MLMMRALRAVRVTEARARAVEQAEAAYAEALRNVDLREREAMIAVSAFEHHLGILANSSAPNSVALSDAHMFLRSLALRADRTRDAVTRARAQAEPLLSALVAARTELKKVEMWQQSLKDAAQQVEDQKERIATDDLAARTHRRRCES